MSIEQEEKPSAPYPSAAKFHLGPNKTPLYSFGKRVRP
jgi:hypothetical protein